MKLTNTEVEHLAKLSRLSLSEEEQEKFSSQLSSILDYVGHLQKVATLQAICAPEVPVGTMRSDHAKKLSCDEARKLVHAAPLHEKDFVITKAVF